MAEGARLCSVCGKEIPLGGCWSDGAGHVYHRECTGKPIQRPPPITDASDAIDYVHTAPHYGRLGTLVTVRDLAKRAGWGYRRMLRNMHAANKQLEGKLLVNLGAPGKRPHYVLATEKLEQLRPEWAASFAGVVDQVEELEGKGEEHDEMVVQANQAIRDLRRELAEVKERVSKLEKGRAA